MTVNPDKFWQDWRTTILTTGWALGKTQHQLADELGCTKSTVAGKVNRLGLPGRREQMTAKLREAPNALAPIVRGQKRPPRPKPEAPELTAIAMPEPSLDDAKIPREQLKHLWELEPGECKFPVNDGGPYLFCAGPAVDGSPYCGGHYLRSRNPGAYRNALLVPR